MPFCWRKSQSCSVCFSSLFRLYLCRGKQTVQKQFCCRNRSKLCCFVCITHTRQMSLSPTWVVSFFALSLHENVSSEIKIVFNTLTGHEQLGQKTIQKRSKQKIKRKNEIESLGHTIDFLSTASTLSSVSCHVLTAKLERTWIGHLRASITCNFLALANDFHSLQHSKTYDAIHSLHFFPHQFYDWRAMEIVI